MSHRGNKFRVMKKLHVNTEKMTKKLPAYRSAQQQIMLTTLSAWPSWFRGACCNFALPWPCTPNSHTQIAFSKESKQTTRTWTFCAKWVDIFLSSVSTKQLISGFPCWLRRSQRRMSRWLSTSSSNTPSSYSAETFPKVLGVQAILRNSKTEFIIKLNNWRHAC